MVKYLNTTNINFEQDFNDLLLQNRCVQNDVSGVVKDILQNVKNHGDQALFDYTKKFDKFLIDNYTIRVRKQEIEDALSNCNEDTLKALKLSAKRITDFHIRHIPENDQITDDIGGKAAYPSSVLMNSIPAKVAGVERIVMVVPSPNGYLNPLVLVAAHISGISEIYKIGGAQAIAALAYGTETVKSVDVIAGPGNAYVAAAKKEVFGTVGIDMIAGPSEILVLADNKNDPSWVAIDLLSQAEHDEMSQSILITDSEAYADKVVDEIEKHLKTMPRADIARVSWQNQGCIIIVSDLNDAPVLINQIAPEHLELAIEDPKRVLTKIRNAGSIFIGRYTPEAIGDYIAGPNHVLPTSGNARFSSGLSALNFMKRTTLIQCDAKSLAKIGPSAMILAGEEGLDAHKESIAIRLEKKIT